MKNHLILVWLFPLLFMIHDFEEIIFLRAWFINNRDYMSKRFPGIAKHIVPHMERVSTQAFSLGVAEEYIIISAVSVFSFTFNNYLVWFGLFFAFTLHLIVHLIQCVILRKYIPSAATAAAVLPYCFYTYAKTLEIAIQPRMLASAALSVVFMLINLILIHRLMERFDKWLDKYVKMEK